MSRFIPNNKGRVHSIESRKHMSEGRKGMKLSEEHKKHIGESGKGKKHKSWKFSEQSRKNISRGHRGVKSHLWKGGITPINKIIRTTIQFRLWREAVFARDNWTCQKYGLRGVELHPHHVLNFADYPELRFAIDNGITLSKRAHDEFHKKYGKKNNTREQLEEFLNS